MYSFIITVLTEPSYDSYDDSYKENIINAYIKYYGYMAKVFSDMLPEGECVDDCIQEVFLSILKSRIELDFSDEKKLKCYLRVCCKNQAMDVLKELPRRNYEELEKSLSDNTADEPIDVIMADDRYERLLDAFESLDEELKSVCYLKYYSELSLKDIAKTLGISSTTVLARLNKAKRRLLRIMTEDFEA